jgi:hypothetical protein
MNDDSTGDGGLGVATTTSGASYVGHTKVSDARCVGYDVPRERSAVDRAVRQTLPRAATQPTAADNDKRRSQRYAIRQHLERAKELATQLVNACQGGDLLELATLGFSLMDELDALWEHRNVREDEWAETLNFLQSALGLEEFERFSVGQCEAIRKVIIEYLGGGAVDPEDVTRIRMILRDCGLDPWKAISALSE